MIRYLLLLLGLLAGIAVYAIDLADIQTVAPYRPIDVPGSDVQITTIDGEQLPEQSIIQLADRCIFAAPPGRYLIVAGDKVGLVRVEGESIEAAKEVDIPAVAEVEQFTEPEKKRIWFLTGPNCPPCETWKRSELAKMEQQGVEVITNGVMAAQYGYSTPSFLLPRGDGSAKMIRGYRTADTLIAEMAKMQK